MRFLIKDENCNKKLINIIGYLSKSNKNDVWELLEIGGALR